MVVALYHKQGSLDRFNDLTGPCTISDSVDATPEHTGQPLSTPELFSVRSEPEFLSLKKSVIKKKNKST